MVYCCKPPANTPHHDLRHWATLKQDLAAEDTMTLTNGPDLIHEMAAKQLVIEKGEYRSTLPFYIK